ncbi:MAG TPA: hypothetical protein DIT18_04495 [Pseudomonas sp.]|nr:hypothetical protein [Pseudomonas sp.]
MGVTPEEKQLWSALSDLFVDTEPDYDAIARVARQHSWEQVRFAFYRRVAPVCVYNALTPVPPVWTGFDDEQLHGDIETYVERESRRLIFGDVVSFMGRVFVWALFRGELAKVKAAMDRPLP